MAYWGPAQPAPPKDMNDWWKMWATLVEKYGKHPNAYFEIFNEPHMYSKEELREIYATWLEKFPDVPRDHILLDGSCLECPRHCRRPAFRGLPFCRARIHLLEHEHHDRRWLERKLQGESGQVYRPYGLYGMGWRDEPRRKERRALRLHGLQPAAEQLFHGLYPRHERPAARLGNGQFLLAGPPRWRLVQHD